MRPTSSLLLASVIALTVQIFAVSTAISAELPATPTLPRAVSIDEPLRLSEAFERTLAVHPDLKLLAVTERRLNAEVELAAQRPALTAELEVENVGGTGTVSVLDGAEVTLSLTSFLERSGKRDARTAVAARQLDALTLQREKSRLDLMAEVARRYLDVVRAQAQFDLSSEDVSQRTRTVEASTRRVQAGASPESVQLAAEAARARAELERDSAEREQASAYRRLALLWSERTPQIKKVVGDLLTLPDVPTAETLAEFIDRSPDLQHFADEQRLREARLQLARTSRSVDIGWRIGVRRFEDSGDWAAVFGLSVPFGTSRRSEPGIHAAEVELDALTIERQSSQLTLFATLSEAHGRYLTAKAQIEQARKEVLPRLARAEAAAEKSYRAGALSYLEWSQIQSETIAARQQLLNAAHEAQRALIEIQRLTGERFAR